MKRARGMKLYVYYGKTGNYLSTRAECMREDCLLLRPAIPNLKRLDFLPGVIGSHRSFWSKGGYTQI